MLEKLNEENAKIGDKSLQEYLNNRYKKRN
jgi:hypothetical protein